MEKQEFHYTNEFKGITGTTNIVSKPAHPDTPGDLNVTLSIRPTGEKQFTSDIHAQGFSDVSEMVEFFHHLAHKLGHEVMDRCIRGEIVQSAVNQTAMEVMVDNAIEQILGTDGA